MLRISEKLLLPAVALSLLALGQVTWLSGAPATNWVAFNDHNSGTGTGPRVTAYSPTAVGTAVGGPLTDDLTGSPLSAGINILAIGSVSGWNGSSAAPRTGTPADQVFAGKIDWPASALYHASGNNGNVTYTFTNLDPSMKYYFRGTAVRGNSYATRWELATITGIVSAKPAHIWGTGSPASPGIVTNGWSPYGDTLVAERQAAWNAGENRCGDLIGWDEIVPNGTSFSVICSNWTVATPGGAGNTTYAYAFGAVMLMEVGEPTPVAITTEPAANTVVGEFRPFSLTAAASGSPTPRYQWYREDTGLITGATSPTYAVAQAQLTDSGNYYVVAYNILNSATSRVATVTVNADVTPPVLLRAIGSATFTNVIMEFSEPIKVVGGPGDPALDVFNYNISVGGVVAVQWLNGNRTAILTVDPPQPENTVVTVGVDSITDLAGNVIGTPNSANYTTWVTSPNCAGGLLFEVYNGTQGPTLAGTLGYSGVTDTNSVAVVTNHATYPNNPSERLHLTTFDTRELYTDNNHERYGGRLRGLFLPPVSGNWIFYLASDDPSQLWLNTNGPSASGKELIAKEDGCCHDWVGGTWVSAPQPLQAGMGYYIEAIYKEGTGGDYCKVAARLDSDGRPPDNPNGQLPVSQYALNPNELGVTAAPLGVLPSISVSQQPLDLNVREGNVGIFTVGISPDVPACYQWQRGGTDIPGAIGPTYAIVPTMADDGAQFSVRITTIGGGTPVTSATATLHVSQDTTPPTLVSAAATDAFQTNVIVTFSEPMAAGPAGTAAHYQIDGTVVASATVSSPTTVVLVPGAPLAPCARHTVSVSAVTDQFGNVISPNPSTASFLSPVVLIAVDDLHQWRYEDTGAVLDGVPWNVPGYDDSSWSNGPAVLSFPTGEVMPAGYLVRTIVAGYVSSRITYYFRTHFTLDTDPSTVTSLELREILDDASAVYLNGVLVHSNRMPGLPYNYLTGATGGGAEPHPLEGPFLLSTSALRYGDNVLAAEVHQSGTASSDIVWGAELIATVTECRPPLMLHIGSAGGNTIITWSDPTAVLQRNPRVDDANGWQDVTGATSPYPVTQPGFYRLKKTQ